MRKCWGQKTYEQKYPGEASGSATHVGLDPSLLPALRDKEVLHTDSGGIPYLQYVNGISDPAWSKPVGRNSRLLASAYRKFTRLSIRGFCFHLNKGTTNGVFKDAEVYKTRVKIVLSSSMETDQSLIVVFLEYIKQVLGDDKKNEELQHFYNMIKRSSIRGKFWMVEHHPILLDVQKRFEFPANMSVWLQGINDWEDRLEVRFPAEVDISSGLSSALLDVYQSNNNLCPEKGFMRTYVGLIRFSRALKMHGADSNRISYLTPQDVEQELCNRFPKLLLVVFEFLFSTLYDDYVDYVGNFMRQWDDDF